MWDSVTVGGGVACFSLMNQITVAQNQSFARMLQKSKDPIPAFYVFTPCSCLTSGLHCVFMPFIFQVKAWASRETRNDKWSTRGQIVTHSDQWPVRSVSLANLVSRTGEARDVDILRIGGFDWFGQKKAELQSTSFPTLASVGLLISFGRCFQITDASGRREFPWLSG